MATKVAAEKCSIITMREYIVREQHLIHRTSKYTMDQDELYIKKLHCLPQFRSITS